MTRRTRAAVLTVALVASLTAACTGDVVAGTAVPAGPSSSSGAGSLSTAARFTDASAIAGLQRDVERGVEAVNSYDYRSLDAARLRGLRYTTGAYSTEYERTFRSLIAKNAPPLKASQQARVADVGVSSLRGATAYLLVVGQLDIRTSNAPGGRKDPFAVVVRATLVSRRWLLSQVSVGASSVSDTPGTAGLQAAVRGARNVTRALASFTRATFDADFARALALLTGSVATDVRNTRASTLKALRDGGFDLSADVLAEGAVSASGERAVVLVSSNGYRVRNGTREANATAQRLRITMVSVGSRWLAAQITSVGVH